MRKTTAILGILLLLSLAGCTLFQGLDPPLTLVASPTSGHPTVEDGGLWVVFRCDGGKEYTLDPGDGSSPLTGGGPFECLYTQAGVYKAVLYSGIGSGPFKQKTVTIYVVNDDPYVRSPHWWAGLVRFGRSAERGEEISFDPMPQEIYEGCDQGTGDPIYHWVTGITDGDDDPIEVRFTITCEDGTQESVFIRHAMNDYEEVSGQWVPLQVLTWFAGYANEEPNYPYMSCDPPIPPDVPGTGSQTTVHCVLEGRDPWGGYGKISWIMYVAQNCSI